MEQRSPRRSRGPWEFDGAKGWGLVGAREGDVKAGVGLREENSHIAEEEFSGSDSDDSEGPPLTYEQLQERTQAARAAVNVLLPQQTDVMAGREGPYGKRRRERKGRYARWTGSAGQKTGG